MILKEFFLKLGLDLDAGSFAKGQLAADLVARSLIGIKNAAANLFSGLVDSVIGGNAEAERLKMSLAGIVGMNLKLPWEQAKVEADKLFSGLQADAARTPADTAELVDFSSQIANAYLKAGKGMADLRQFTTQAVVAAKMLNLEGTAALDITQALSKNGVGAKDRFALSMIATQGLTQDQFNAKSVKERVEILTKAFNSPTIRSAMAEYEHNWAGVTSTLKDNAGIIAREAGKPLFDLLKGVLFGIGSWVARNKDSIIKFFTGLWRAFALIGRVIYIVGDVVARLVGWFYKFGAATGTLLTALSALAIAVVLFGASSVSAALASAAAWVLAALPVIALVAAIGLALLILEDVYTGLTGGNSLIFEIWNNWKKFMAEWLAGDEENDPWWLRMIKQLLRFIFDTEGAWARVADAWKQIFNDFVEWVRTLFTNLWADAKKIAKDAIDAVNPFSGFSGPDASDTVLGGRGGSRTFTPLPRNLTVAPSMKIENLTVQTTGDAADVTSKVRKTIEEHHEMVMRATREALGQ